GSQLIRYTRIAGVGPILMCPDENRDDAHHDGDFGDVQFSLAFHISPSKHWLRAIHLMVNVVLQNYHKLRTIPAKWSAFRAVVLKGISASWGIVNQRKPSRPG